jgi:hypothetical protein
MSIDAEKLRVLIPTTSGLAEVLLLTEEDPAIGRSVACIGGTTETADIDAAYHAFVARPTGVIERMFGHSCYRLDVSGRIDAGSSWQLGALTAHALYAAGRLGQERDTAEGMIWATGSVRAVDLTVGAVSHLGEKLTLSLDRLKQEAKAGGQVLVAIPAQNAAELSQDIRADLDAHGIQVLEVATVQALWQSLGLKLGEGTPKAAATDAPRKLTHGGGASRWSNWAAAVAVLAIAALGGGVALRSGGYWPALKPSDAPDRLQLQLVAALAKSLPNVSIADRARGAEVFVKAKGNRVMAVAGQAQRTWLTIGWPSRELAEEKALERCQQYYDEPCALIASNDFITEPGSDGSLPVRDAPRVRYTGVFNPERIPGIRKNVEQRIDVAGYLTAASPKASAFHAAGILHVIAGAPSQRAAEEQALRACNDDPARKPVGGPCYLYSVDNRVVLTLRATGAITSAAPAHASAIAIRDILPSILAKIAPAYPFVERQVREYLESNGHKAFAAYPPSSSWRTNGWETAAVAEERVLEGCQVRYGEPCVLLAVNDTVHGNSAAQANWPRRPMSRVAYEGSFDPSQIPVSTPALRQRVDVAGYRAAPSPKAAAFHPRGRLFVVTGAETQRAAEEQALAACNHDPNRGGRDGACLLYAVDNLVVLPKRLSAPMTAQ